jgi:hypothetical protein
MAYETSPIQKFYSVAQNRDFARLFQFKLISFGDIAFGANHLVYVETASVPGRSISNIPVTFMGMDFNTPGTVKYPGSAGYQVTFRCDQNYDIRAALEASTFNTFDESTSQGTYGVPGTGRTLVMQLFNKRMEAVRHYTLYGVWVQNIADTQYDVKDIGQIQSVQCTLAYQFWRSGLSYPSLKSGQEALPSAATDYSQVYARVDAQGYPEVQVPAWNARTR